MPNNRLLNSLPLCAPASCKAPPIGAFAHRRQRVGDSLLAL
jgi:hypothetical protein